MGMLTFSDDPPKIYVVPRLEDHLIDELFYQEDEIGEMRHTAFMIECGLEEDPPDGPDVPPTPWKTKSGALLTTVPLAAPRSPLKSKRDPPNRSSSMDDIDELEEDLASPSRRERRERPTRTGKIFASRTKSGTFHGMRKFPEKAHSADSLEDKKEDSPKRPKRLVAAKSGSLHGMRDAARQAKELEDSTNAPSQSPLRRSKLVATKSGTLHGMRKALEGSAADDKPVLPRARRLVATKSGTLHGMREAAMKAQTMETKAETSKPLRRVLRSIGSDHKSESKDDTPKSTRRSSDDSSLLGSQIRGSSHQLRKRVTRKKTSSGDTSESGSESLSDFGDSTSDLASDVSLDTDEDVPKSPAKGPIKKKVLASEKKTKESKKVGKDVKKEIKPDEVPVERKRVFKNGKLVFDDGGCESPVKSNGTTSASERFRNGSASPAELRRNAQAGTRPKSSPKKSTSIAQIGSAFKSSGVPPAFQQMPTTRTRPGKLKIPSKAKSISVIDIPPAFRTGGAGK